MWRNEFISYEAAGQKTWKKKIDKTRLRLEMIYLMRISIEMIFGRFILKVDPAERNEKLLIVRNIGNDIAWWSSKHTEKHTHDLKINIKKEKKKKIK